MIGLLIGILLTIWFTSVAKSVDESGKKWVVVAIMSYFIPYGLYAAWLYNAKLYHFDGLENLLFLSMAGTVLLCISCLVIMLAKMLNLTIYKRFPQEIAAKANVTLGIGPAYSPTWKYILSAVVAAGTAAYSIYMLKAGVYEHGDFIHLVILPVLFFSVLLGIMARRPKYGIYYGLISGAVFGIAFCSFMIFAFGITGSTEPTMGQVIGTFVALSIMGIVIATPTSLLLSSTIWSVEAVFKRQRFLINEAKPGSEHNFR